MILYRLRDVASGLFSTGGTNPKFNKKGKIWLMKGHLKNHIRQYKNEKLLDYIDNLEIVKYELVEEETTSILDFITDGDPAEQLLILDEGY